MPNNISEHIQNAASIEATPALVDFWNKQFQGFVGQKFKYDDNSKIGSIDLMRHLTSDKKDIDHQLLQQTIAVLIRFLDALTTDLDYRSIKLSVENFDQFLKSTDTPAQIGADYVGGLIADFSYRASENLAHEKGAFLKFKSLPKHIRAIEYEMWTDVSGDYKNGQEIATMFDDVSIAVSDWSLVPRRNFAILDFPNDLDLWDKWRDSYSILAENSSDLQVGTGIDAVEEINIENINTHNQTSENMLNDIGQGLNQDLDFNFDSEFSVPAEAEKSIEKTVSKVSDFPDLNQIKANLDQVNDTNPDSMSEVPQIPTTPELEQFNFPDTDLYDGKNIETIAPAQVQKQPARVIEIEKQGLYSDDNQQTDAPTQSENLTQAVQGDPQLSETKSPSDEIVLGELVKIIEETSPWHGKVFQVIEIGGSEIRLAGQDQDLQNHVFTPHQLQKQNLYEILEHINNTSLETEAHFKAELPIAKAAALIINDQNKILLVRETLENGDTNLTLPSTTIKYNQIPEEAILKYLQVNLHSSEAAQTRIIDEVGSVMVAANHDNSNGLVSENCIFNIFSVAISQNLDSTVENFEFVNLNDTPKELMLVKIALDKHNRKQKIIAESVSHHISQYQKEQEQAHEENLNQIRAEIRADLESKIKTTLEPELRAQILAEQSQIVAQENNNQLDLSLPEYVQDAHTEAQKQTQMTVSTNQENQTIQAEPASNIPVTSYKAPGLAKFKVKLEHWIESDKFGNMALSLGYSSKGIDSVSLSESSLESGVKSTINLILHLFNHLLDHGLDLQELLAGLNLNYGENEVPVNQILSLILGSITSAPQKISHISDEWLV